MRRVPFSQFRFVRALALGAVLLASTTSCHLLDTPLPATRPVTVVNQLIAPITVSLASAGVANLACCGAIVVGDANLTVTQLLWTPPARATFPSGATGIDDLPSSQSFDRLLTIVHDSVTITNTIGPFRYVGVKVDNRLTVPVQVAIARTAGLLCLGTHPPTSSAGYWGYWKYAADTEVRIYAANSSCTGSFITFDNNVLAASAANTGLVTLVVTTAP